MDNNFKRAMKLMWANKRMRKAFVCDFGLRGNGEWLLALVVFAALPLFEMVSGIELTFLRRDTRWQERLARLY